MIRVFVPRDSGALSVGRRGGGAGHRGRGRGPGCRSVELVRNGSRGLYWLEPMVEVETPAGRLAYGPVAAADVPGLFEPGFLREADIPWPSG